MFLYGCYLSSVLRELSLEIILQKFGLWIRKEYFYLLRFWDTLRRVFFYIPTLLSKGLVLTSIIWSLLSIIGFLLIGLVVFKEILTSMQIIGVSLGIIALIILAFAD